MERDSSQCLRLWFSSGDFRRLRFHELRLGRSGALPVSWSQSWGLAPLLSTLGQSLGQESLPCLQHTAWVPSTSPPREWPSS